MSQTACTARTPVAESETLVFASQRTGNGDLYELGAGAPRPLSENTEVGEGGPRLDSWRSRLVFQRFDDAGAEIRSDGERLFRDPNGDTPPSWSPNGDLITFVRPGDGTAYIYVGPVEHPNQASAVTAGEVIDRYPVFDPSGRRIAFCRRTETGWDLYTLDLVTGDVEQITTDGVFVAHPAWSPDGRFIAFDRWYDGQTELAQVDLISGETTRLTRREANDMAPAWSADGRRLAFASDEGGDWEVWEMTLDTGSLARLTHSPGFDGAPVYVPSAALR